jgi:hypothetical protein
VWSPGRGPLEIRSLDLLVLHPRGRTELPVSLLAFLEALVSDRLQLPTCALCDESFHLGSRCAKPIPEGRRNDSLFRIGVRLIRWGGRWFGAEQVEEFLLVENERRCGPPLPEFEVRTIAASANRTVRPSLRREVVEIAA